MASASASWPDVAIGTCPKAARAPWRRSSPALPRVLVRRLDTGRLRRLRLLAPFHHRLGHAIDVAVHAVKDHLNLNAHPRILPLHSAHEPLQLPHLRATLTSFRRSRPRFPAAGRSGPSPTLRFQAFVGQSVTGEYEPFKTTTPPLAPTLALTPAPLPSPDPRPPLVKIEVKHLSGATLADQELPPQSPTPPPPAGPPPPPRRPAATPRTLFPSTSKTRCAARISTTP